jgi:hypothetical protein
MERTAIPPRVNINHLRLGSPDARRGIGNHHLMLDDVDSMIIEPSCIEQEHDAVARRQRDGGRARKQLPPNVTLENVDRNDGDPGGS